MPPSDVAQPADGALAGGAALPADAALPASLQPITLSSADVTCTVLAGKGADVYSFVDVRTGVDVLFKTPWALRDPALLPPFGDSKVDWLARYPGGWQLLVPNAGDERISSGAPLGFHGEAATVPWQVQHADRSSITLSTRLITAPLHLDRQVRLDGPRLVVTDEITNESPDEVSIAWSEHVAFGRPFLDGDSRLHFGATRFVSDLQAPGTVLAPGVSTALDAVRDIDGHPVDLGALPALGERRELFGTLTGFATGWCAVTSPTCGFGVRLEWPAEVLPNAWLWQELSASRGFPWFRRAHVVGIEPSNVPTTHDPGTGADRVVPPVLGAGATARVDVVLSRFDLDAAAAS